MDNYNDLHHDSMDDIVLIPEEDVYYMLTARLLLINSLSRLIKDREKEYRDEQEEADPANKTETSDGAGKTGCARENTCEDEDSPRGTDDSGVWICRQCGHIQIGSGRPGHCSGCFTPNSCFEVQAAI